LSKKSCSYNSKIYPLKNNPQGVFRLLAFIQSIINRVYNDPSSTMLLPLLLHDTAFDMLGCNIIAIPDSHEQFNL